MHKVERGVSCAGCPHRAAYIACKEALGRGKNKVICGNAGCAATGYMHPAATTCTGGEDALLPRYKQEVPSGGAVDQPAVEACIHFALDTEVAADDAPRRFAGLAAEGAVTILTVMVSSRAFLGAEAIEGLCQHIVEDLRIDDVVAVDPLDTLVGDARKAYLKEQAAKLKAAQKAAAAKARKEKLEEIAKKRQDKTTAKLLAQKEREERRLAARKLKAESKLRARQARAARKGKVIPVDSTALREIDSLIARNDREMDSLLLQMADSLAADSLAMRIPADSVDSLTDSADSVYRLMKGFRNVRIFRSDFQAVCDSMTAISTDSTIHLYINPVLWNQGNQITSDVMDIFTENQQITRAEFIGTPMMVSQLDTVHYNQVAGKQMTAWFRDNQIYRNDVNGNAQTIYYMQDGEPPQITGMGVIESGDCSFYIEDKQVVTIVYRKDPDWNIYPMDKIPADQELYLKGFKWEGARRPTQGAVFDRRVRPSQREEKRHLAHPDFPLLKALEERKKRLIEERRWADRNDQVDAATVEWMRALGFEVGQPRESGPKL